MKTTIRLILPLILIGVGTAFSAVAQDSQSSATMRRRNPGGGDGSNTPTATTVTPRMQAHFEDTPTSEADLQWMKIVYRSLDLNQAPNTPLYFPDEPIDGQENLFRIIMRLLASGQLTPYEYLDGRELFTDRYVTPVRDILDRFHIIYTPARGSNDRAPRFDIDDSDVPASEVLSYYIIERWEFDNRSNRLRTVVDAICPVLHRSGDFGGEAVRYPMFWVRFDQLRPYLSAQTIFTDDRNNLATCTYDDYFQLGLYKGDIYKTRNLRNQSLMQLYPDPEDLARAQDSIQNELDHFADKLWITDPMDPSARATAAVDTSGADDEGNDNGQVTTTGTGGDDQPEAKPTRTSRGKSTKAKKPKATKPRNSGSSGSATRSVRNRRR